MIAALHINLPAHLGVCFTSRSLHSRRASPQEIALSEVLRKAVPRVNVNGASFRAFFELVAIIIQAFQICLLKMLIVECTCSPFEVRDRLKLASDEVADQYRYSMKPRTEEVDHCQSQGQQLSTIVCDGYGSWHHWQDRLQ